LKMIFEKQQTHPAPAREQDGLVSQHSLIL